MGPNPQTSGLVLLRALGGGTSPVLTVVMTGARDRRDPRPAHNREVLAMDQLIVCPVCHRHVKGADEACPFCRNTMPARTAAAIAGAAVVGLALTLAACSSSTTSGNGGGGTTVSTSASNTGGGAVVMYGPPPPTDAGTGGQGGAITAYAPPPHP
jgi:hypothetical protein